LLNFYLHALRHLPRSDPFNGLSDPFVKVYWKRGSNGEEVKFYTTKHLSDVENADWNETIEFTNYIGGSDQVHICANWSKYEYLHLNVQITNVVRSGSCLKFGIMMASEVMTI